MTHPARMIALTLAMALPAPGVALAQTAPVAAAPAPDPARLAAAKSLIGKIMPADRMDAMIEQMMAPMMASLRDAMAQEPGAQAALADNPEARAAISTFIEGESARSIALAKASMPAMVDAMARAYARRFSLAQLNDIDAFFGTPSGRAYAEQAGALMSDPDIIAVQRAMMMKGLEGIQQRAGALSETLVKKQETK